MTLKTETAAMARGMEDHVWTIRERIEGSAKFSGKKRCCSRITIVDKLDNGFFLLANHDLRQ
jgi:hypothetical protein